MAIIPETCTLEVNGSQVGLSTSANGDTITIGMGKSSGPMQLTHLQAATLSWLINQGIDLEIKFRVKP